MSQLTNPSLSRAPVSIRKMVQIIQDPVILTSIATFTTLVGFGTWYYYLGRRMS
jgi:hypothetical protein